MTATSLRVEDLGKAYKQYARPLDRVWDWLRPGHPRHALVWPVRGVSFEVAAGESVGIIGQNGAGKSTLVRLIRGVIFPTTGSIHVNGSLSALDLGLGFHADFTGRENLHAGGPLLGLSSEALSRRIPEIEAFAEIGDYLDRPVRTYSTGMRMRLAFSLATTLRPDILVIDEALAVGDAYFQQKCVRRIEEFLEQGTTLLFVSHDQAAIRRLCSRVLLLDEGILVRDGPAQPVLEYYNGTIAHSAEEYRIRQGDELLAEGGTTRHGGAQAVIDSLEISADGRVASAFTVGAKLRVRVAGHAAQDLDDLTVGVLFRDRLGSWVFGTNTHHLGIPIDPVRRGQRFVATFELPLNIGVGVYSITASLHAGASHVHGNYDWWDGVRSFQVLPGDEAPFSGSCYLPASASLELRPAGDETNDPA